MPFYENVKEMPLGDVLENHTGVPVYIQHDISAWTMAEALVRAGAAGGRNGGVEVTGGGGRGVRGGCGVVEGGRVRGGGQARAEPNKTEALREVGVGGGGGASVKGVERGGGGGTQWVPPGGRR